MQEPRHEVQLVHDKKETKSAESGGEYRRGVLAEPLQSPHLTIRFVDQKIRRNGVDLYARVCSKLFESKSRRIVESKLPNLAKVPVTTLMVTLEV